MENHKRILIVGMILLMSAIGFSGAITLSTYMKSQDLQKANGPDQVTMTTDGKATSSQIALVSNKKQTDKVGKKPQTTPKALSQLSNAIMCNDMDTVKKYVIDDQVDLNQKNEDGEYPLESVFVFDNVEMATFLIQHGANPDLKTADGKTIRDRALAQSNQSLKDAFSPN